MKRVLLAAAASCVLIAGAAFAGKFTGTDASDTKPAAKVPVIKAPVMFNTPEADAILSKMQIFPKDNPWNQDISKLPVLKNSREMIATVGANGSLQFNWDMGFILIPPDQRKVNMRVAMYPGESDKGPFPIPPNMPIEGWPMEGGDLAVYQRAPGDSDRHGIIVDPVNGALYEFWQARLTNGGWECSQASVFNLKTNDLRPDGWTSSDAAGLPIFPAIVRYDDVERGIVNHAMRFTVKNSRNAYIYPARHKASNKKDPNLPRMGERFRLRKDFDVSKFSPHAQAVLRGLQKYGMFMADNGGNWRLSVAPDSRIKGLDELRRVKGSDFEVVDTTAK